MQRTQPLKRTQIKLLESPPLTLGQMPIKLIVA